MDERVYKVNYNRCSIVYWIVDYTDYMEIFHSIKEKEKTFKKKTQKRVLIKSGLLICINYIIQ